VLAAGLEEWIDSGRLRRFAHRSVTEREADVRRWINEWNNNPKPFVWTKTADQILETLAAYCQRIDDSGRLAAEDHLQRTVSAGRAKTS
jgi:hypothetical protein